MAHTNRVQDWMSSPVVAVPTDATVRQTLELMLSREISHVVVMQGATFMGVACVCDLLQRRPEETMATDLRSPVVVVPPSTRVEEAAAIMARDGIGSLPVMDRGVLGILTRSDLRRAGVLSAENDESCAACGGCEHVRHDPRSHLPLCLECLLQWTAPDPRDELGWGD